MNVKMQTNSNPYGISGPKLEKQCPFLPKREAGKFRFRNLRFPRVSFFLVILLGNEGKKFPPSWNQKLRN